MERKELVFKVLSGDASEIELSEFKSWISSGSEAEIEFDALKLLWDKRNEGQVQADDPSYDALRSIKKSIKKKTRQKVKNQRILFAIGLVVIAVGFLLYPKLGEHKTSKHRFEFTDASLEEIASILEAEYGVNVSVADSLASCRYSGTFYNDSARDVLTLISSSLNVNFQEIAVDSFVVSGGHCHLDK